MSGASLAAIDSYVRAFYKQLSFPGIDDNGVAFVQTKAGVSGRQAAKCRQKLVGRALTKHLNEHFPHGAIHYASSAEKRALSHVKPAKTDFFNRAKQQYSWDAKTMEKAMTEFELPTGTKMLFLFPEIFDRVELLKHDEYRFSYTDADGKKKVGVKTPCPWCKTNKFVKVSSKTGYKTGQHRTIFGFRTRIPVYTFIESCSNPECIGDPKKAAGDDSDKVSVHTFHLYQPHVWKNYPASLRERYMSLLHTDAIDGADGSIFVTEELCSELLKDKSNFSEITRYMQDAHERLKHQAVRSYVSFVHSQGNTQEEANQWPDFNWTNYDALFKPPTVKTLIKVFTKCFDLVFESLKRDLFARTPGKILRYDGTYLFLKKTKDDEQSEEKNECLHVIWGEYGHIISWAFGDAENDECFQRLCYFLRERCDLFGEDRKNEVKAAYSDTCCGGLKDPTKHWITQVFPKVKRAPYKDSFHAQKQLSDSMRQHHELVPVYCRELSKCFTAFDEASLNHVAGLFRKKVSTSLAPELAREELLKKKQYRVKVKKTAPLPRQMEAKLRSAYSKIQQEDDRLCAEKAETDDGYLSCILSQRGGRLGSEAALENVVNHVRKGCCRHPLPMEEMNVALDPSDIYTDYLSLQGTSTGEAFNKCINEVVAEVTRQSAEMANMKMWLRSTRYNLAKDAKLDKVLGIEKPRSLEWYLHEALLGRFPNLEEYKGVNYPPQLPNDYFEPIGIEYGRYKQWTKIEATIDSWMEITRMARQLRSSPRKQQQESAAAAPPPPPPPPPPTAVAAAPTAVAAAPTAVAAAPTAAVAKRRGDFYSPQKRWSRKLGPMTAYTVCVMNQYLADGDNLTHSQTQAFWSCVAEVADFSSSTAAKASPELVAKCWNARHVRLMKDGENTIGLGGLLREAHAKKIMLSKGYEVKAHQIDARHAAAAQPPPARPPVPSFRQTLDRQRVATLSYRDQAMWLKKMSLKVKGTPEERKQRLLGCFEGKPQDYKLFL